MMISRKAWWAGIAALSAFVAALGVPAQTRSPGDALSARLASARGGETIVLDRASYGTLTFPKRRYDPAITLNAENANFTGLVLKNVEGVNVRGGTVTGPGGRSYGINILDSAHVRIERMTITGAHRGIVVGRSHDVAVVGNALVGLISDGINAGTVRNVLIDGNTCRDFNPTPAVYDTLGNRLRDGDHPDCIQSWSRPPAPPTSYLTIVNNMIDGRMQGIFLGNHVRNGVDDGGFDHVVIRNNRVRVGAPNAIRVDGGRDVDVRNNVVETLPGVVLPKPPFRPIRPTIHVAGERLLVCGNHIESFPDATGTRRCSQ